MKTTVIALVATLVLSATACEKKQQAITGRLTLSPELQKTLQPSAVLYVIARAAGQGGGPPTAVKRFAQPLAFPMEFSISGADAMMPGTPFEGAMTLTARVSQSGSATPVNAGDIEAAPAQAEAGTRDLVIKLDQVK